MPKNKNRSYNEISIKSRMKSIIVNDDKSYGYYFDEDLTTGILIGEDGKARDAIELDESVARDLVKTTVVGE